MHLGKHFELLWCFFFHTFCHYRWIIVVLSLTSMNIFYVWDYIKGLKYNNLYFNRWIKIFFFRIYDSDAIKAICHHQHCMKHEWSWQYFLEWMWAFAIMHKHHHVCTMCVHMHLHRKISSDKQGKRAVETGKILVHT